MLITNFAFFSVLPWLWNKNRSSTLLAYGLFFTVCWYSDSQTALVTCLAGGVIFLALQFSYKHAAKIIFASIVGIVLVGFFFLRSGLKSSLRIALDLILGGACGNLIDRVIKGEVPDFIKFPEWPTFNVADSAITIGVVLLLWVIYHETESQVATTEAR